MFPELRDAGLGEGSHRRSGGGRAPRSRGDLRVVVRQEGEEGDDSARPGWDATSAVRDDRIFEIKSTYILQPGPASLTDGVLQMHAILASLSTPAREGCQPSAVN